MKPQSADFISKKASFPPQSRKEAHRRGTTLTYTSGSIKKDEIKKALSHRTRAPMARYHPALYSTSLTRTNGEPTHFSPKLPGDTPAFHTGFHPPGSLSLPAKLNPAHRLCYLTDIIIGPAPPVKNGSGKEIEPPRTPCCHRFHEGLFNHLSHFMRVFSPFRSEV